MKIIFVARSINRMAGGVERMIATIMNALAERGHIIKLLTWDTSVANSFYPISSKVEWKKLNLGDPSVKANIFLKLQRAKVLRKWFRAIAPQIIVCFQDGPFIAAKAYLFGMKIPIIAAERNAPTRFNYISNSCNRNVVFQMLRFAKRIIIQFDSYKELYPSFLHGRIVTIPNPVSLPNRCGCPGTPNENGRFRILSVGRLSYQKNYPVLINAFAEVAGDFPNWDLVILGEGEERKRLQEIIEKRELSNRILLLGTQVSISNWYISSHLFCLSSRWEGFPNALAEAMAHGLPCIGFEGCAGISELIDSGVTGFLAPGNNDYVSFARVLKKVMSSSKLREEVGTKARESIKKYSPEYIFSQWEEVLKEAIS